MQNAFIEIPNYVSDGPGYTGRILFSLQGNKLIQQTFHRKETFESNNFGGHIQRRGVSLDGVEVEYLETKEVVLHESAPVVVSAKPATPAEVTDVLAQIVQKEEAYGWADYLAPDRGAPVYDASRVVLLSYGDGTDGFLLLGGESFFALLKTAANLYSIDFDEEETEFAVYTIE